MMESPQKANQEAIEELINSIADYEPPFSSLGTPFIVDTEATQALVQIGDAAVPALIKALDAEEAKVTMYAAYCLGLMRDQSALPALQKTKEKYAVREPKDQYDFAVIGAIKQAVDKLLASGK